MRAFSVNIPLLDESRNVVETQNLDASDDGKRVMLSFGEGPLSGQKFQGADYFWELSSARIVLEHLNLLPACKGALKCVFPGGLQGETSLGLIAYMFSDRGEVIGRVNIFENAELKDFEKISKFCDQKAFRKSIRGGRFRFPTA